MMQNVFYVVSVTVATDASISSVGTHAFMDKKEAHEAYVETIRSYIIAIYGTISEQGSHAVVATETELNEMYASVLIDAIRPGGIYILISEDEAYLFRSRHEKLSHYNITYSKVNPYGGMMAGVDVVVARTVSEALQVFARKHGPLANAVKVVSTPVVGFDEEFFKGILSNC
jgi:hypothetical protein